jgi:dolichyl-phosphate beta-glucosyltransferase
MLRTAIIVPCHNESQRLKIQEFTTYLEKNKDVFFVFVNDGSTDGTIKLLNEMRYCNPSQVDVINCSTNKGKSEAVRSGFLKTLPKDFDYIGYWDADLSTPLSTIEKFKEILNSSSLFMVAGSRVKLLGKRIERKMLRHYLGRLFATFASLVLDIEIYDTQCGAKLFRKNCLLDQIFTPPFKVNWAFDVEIFARLKFLIKQNDLLPIEEIVVEYPLDEWLHVSGSKVRWRDFFIGIYEIIIIYLNKNSFFNDN